MSGKNPTFSNSLLALIFNATAIATIAQNNSTSPLTNLYVALHTADPTSSGSQSTSEVAYTGYARVAVARTSSGWVVTGASVSPASTISFPACTGGTASATYWSVGTSSTGAGEILYAGAISPTLSISNGVTPQLTSSTTVSEA